MEATRDPIATPEIESATPGLDVARRGAARGNPQYIQVLEDASTRGDLGEQEEVAARGSAATDISDELRQYLSQYSADLNTSFRAWQDRDNFDRGQALSEVMQSLTGDINRIPADYDGPFRQELIDLYQDYATKARLATMTDQQKADEFDRDVQLRPGADEAMARVRTESRVEEAVPPPNQSGQGIDRHLAGVLSTMNAMSDRSRRLYPAEMSSAVQNMRGAPLAASYVQPRDAADADYMAAVEHELLRTRQLKRRGMRKSRRQ
jgi:hypothetical protein